MAQATVTGRGGVQVALHVHGQAIDPLNIEPAKDLWAALGRAIDQAERNRADLVENGHVAEGAPPEGHAPAADDGLPEGVATAADMPEAEPAGQTDFSSMTKDELHAFLEASGVDAPASAKKDELVKMAEEV